MTQQEMSKKEWAILALLITILFAAQSWVTYRYLVQPNPGANDFYSRWAGAKALLLDGRDPYSLAVTEEIQVVIRIRPEQVGRGGFHYPLHVTFLFLPLVYLPYNWAQAIWQTALVWVIIGTVLVLLSHYRWRPSPPGLAALLIVGIFFYPAARSVLLGQFTLHVTLFVALSLLCLRNGRDGWAGIFLAATSIKPQMVAALGIFLLVWAIQQKRWRFVAGVLGSGAAMFLAALLLYPRWPISFVQDMFRYSDVAGGRNPLRVLLELLALPEGIYYVAAAVFIAFTLFTWVRAWRNPDWQLLMLALFWTMVVNVLVPFQTGTTNQAILLIPFFAWLHMGIKRWGHWPPVGATAVLIFGLWVLFINTISGDYENQILFLPLPMLSLAILIASELRQNKLANLRIEAE